MAAQNLTAIAMDSDSDRELMYLSETTRKGTLNLCYRCFVGAKDEADYDDARVFIFPKNEGEEKETPKYHSEGCYQLTAHKKDTCISVTKTEAEGRGYEPCLSCGGK